jgi:hypothetical protein
MARGEEWLGERRVLRLGGKEEIKAQYVGQFVQLSGFVLVLPTFRSVGDDVVFDEFIRISPHLLDIIIPNILITQQGIE